MHRLILLFLLFAAACKKEEKRPPIDHALDLDGTQVNDSSILFPSEFLLSAAQSHFVGEDAVIAVHGFSASNFEWLEFHSFCRQKRDVHVSRVLLGGHGRDYDDFKNASWEDWQKPVIDEYKKLRSIGYQRIHFVAASTGCPLVLDMLAFGGLDLAPGHVIFVDPIVVPSNKQLSLAPALGGTVIHYTESGLDPNETGRWYKFRPARALKELDILTRHIRKKLEKGITVGEDLDFHIYKSEHDGSADPVSAVIIEKGINRCRTHMVASGLHVFTRLAGRAIITEADVQLQQSTFAEFYSIIKSK